MRFRALFGGLFFIVAVAHWHGSSAFRSVATGPNGQSCPSASDARFCAAVIGLAAAFRDPILQPNHGNILPPPQTPGAIDPAITQAMIDTTVCRPGYAGRARPALGISAPFKRRLMNLQYPGQRMADYELDHLIPISIGGAPFDRRNLWLQPRRGRANAADKNKLAYVLWRLVCEHRLPLRTAQQAISRDWTQAYATYATRENVARYHFRSHETLSDPSRVASADDFDFQKKE